jgi:hypothetical protein
VRTLCTRPIIADRLAVGGNAVSAFLSWRLQATNACDVTLVWKSGFESVAQYGISFKYAARETAIAPTLTRIRSALYGNERFKPHSGEPSSCLSKTRPTLTCCSRANTRRCRTFF